MRVAQELILTEPTIEVAWELYVEAFAEISEHAVQQHLMTFGLFADICRNRQIRKFLAYDDSRNLVGLATITNDLASWPLVAPSYFARHEPEEFKQEAVWYIGFVGTRPNQLHAFPMLISAMYPLVNDSDGIAVMDFCAVNVTRRRLPEVTAKLLSRLNPSVRSELIDTQQFWAYRFDKAA